MTAAAIPLVLAGAGERTATWLAAAPQAAELGLALIPYRPGATFPGHRYCLIWRPVPGFYAALPDLALIFSLGAGIERLLADPELPARLPIRRMAEPGLTRAMAQYALWQVLYHHRRIARIEAQQKRHLWREADYPAPAECRVGILGLGRLGAAAAILLRDFGFSVAGWSRSQKSIPGIASFAGPDALDAFLSDRDILLCLLPLTAATRHFLDADLFARMKPGARLIHMGRGDHLVEVDLLAALASEKIAGASLDVFAEEPLPEDHPFWSHPGLCVTPHLAGFTEPETALPEIARAIAEFEKGRRPDLLVDRAQGY